MAISNLIARFQRSNRNTSYALRVRGNSMRPRYRAGELVIVEPALAALPGDDVVVCMHDGRRMLKELCRIDDDEVQLLSINNGRIPLTLRRDQIESIQLVSGRARANTQPAGLVHESTP